MKIHEMFRQQPEVRSFLPDVTIPTNRCVGIEVEVENARSLYDENFKYWDIKEDSSLRNRGAEIVFRQPLAGADLRAALHELNGIFHTHPNLNASERTSVHVHIDARDLDQVQVSRVLTAYIAAESALYKLGGKTRYDNIYCPGVSAALEQMNTMRKIVCPRNTEEFIVTCHEWCKYTGINLRSLVERGSIEFRAHEGTLSVNRIRDWVSVLLMLFRYAEGDGGIEGVLADSNRGPVTFAERVFRHKAPIVLEDGVYEQFYKNNFINLVDLLRDPKEYKPERNKKAASEDPDTEDILRSLEELLS